MLRYCNLLMGMPSGVPIKIGRGCIGGDGDKAIIWPVYTRCGLRIILVSDVESDFHSHVSVDSS